MRYPHDSLFEEIKYRLQHPRLFAHTVNALYYRALSKLGILPEGVDVFSRDWDNLIILDACRYDAFEGAIRERGDIDGQLSKIRSRGPSTSVFLRKNVHQRVLHDTVYVTSSPHVFKSNRGEDKEIEHHFHDVIHVWREDHHPATTVEAVKKAAEEYPNKRLFIHVAAPHQPYHGERGKEVFGEIESNLWAGMMKGELRFSRDVLWETYMENLHIGLDAVSAMFEHLTGKTVISSDHGQLLGDREFPIPIRAYGHPGTYVPTLIEVPYFECPYENRRRIVPEEPIGDDSDVTEAEAKESLRLLGYIDA